MQPMTILRAKAVSRIRRWSLGVLLKLPGSDADPASLLKRFPDEALMPLRRDVLDPVPALGAIRSKAPVSRLKMPLGLRGWLVTGYGESREILAAASDTFSNDFGNMIGKVGIAAEQDPGGLGFADPPAHTRLRRMLQPHFTTRALALQAPRIRQIVEEAIADVARAGAGGAIVDLQKQFALPIPSRVIMELLGIEETDHEEFHRLSTVRFSFADGATASLEVIQESIDYLQKIVAAQRLDPGPGLIGTILTDYGDDIEDIELAGLADGVLVGGLETSVSMLALGTIVLLQNPDTFASLRDSDDDVEAIVEELLRYLTVVQVGFPRFAVRDVTVGTKHLFAGDVVVPSLSGANRDARQGRLMEGFDPGRSTSPHLAFGHGVHRCVGAELARLELRMAYPALVRAFPRLKLAVPADQLSYRDVSIVYGVESLPVTLT